MNLSLICMALIFWANWTHASEISCPLVIAHRGARSLAPENTLAAAMAAWRLGADGWELDVRMTKDGELILMHDETLSRTTNAPSLFPNRSPWLVSDFTLEEIKMLDAGSWFVDQDPYGTIAAGEVSPEEAAKFRGEKVPTLKEALALTKELGFWVNIELKSRPSFALSPQTKALADRTVALIAK
jgi:glycerophosphoryl diester phosphodiesterase